jgi:hypothetical protein
VNKEELDIRFKHHKPRNQDDLAAHERVRQAAHKFAEFINEITPESREQSLAISAIEEASLWANKALARQRANEVKQ